MEMENLEQKIYRIYKPLKNHLKKLNLDDSLFVIWAYAQHLQFNNKIPKEIEVAQKFLIVDDVQKMRWCSIWYIEFLTKEIILNVDNSSFGTESLKKWNYFSRAIENVKRIESELDYLFINKDNVDNYFFRMAHKQFPWQKDKPNQTNLVRYYEIFSYNPLNKFFEDILKISSKDFFTLAVAFLGVYLKSPALNFPIKNGLGIVEEKYLERFIDIFSIEINDLKNKIKNEKRFDENLFYSFSSLNSFPVIKMKYRGQDNLICPIPTLFFRQITSGVYYKIIDEIKKNNNEEEQERLIGEFGNLLGEGFEKYVNKVLIKSLKNLNFKSEEEYIDLGKKRKDTVDYLIFDENTILFVECKTKKLIFSAKSELNNEEHVKKQLEIMSEIIKQTYKNVFEYKNNKYPNFKNTNKKIYPVILTLEEWFLFIPEYLSILDIKVKEKFKKENLPENYLKDYPYSICSISDFEEIIQVMDKIGIDCFMKEKFVGEFVSWTFDSFLNNKFKNELAKVKFLFENEYKSIFRLDEIKEILSKK